MRRKKKGSALVTTIIIFGALITVGVALLSMSLGDYKLMQSQNKRIKNLYGSDSGLDVAYDIIIRDFDSAAQFGAFKAKQLEVADVNKKSPYKGSYETLQDDLKTVNNWNSTHEDSEKKSATQLAKERKEITDKMDDLKNKEFRRSFKAFLYNDEIAKSDIADIKYETPNMLRYSLDVEQDNDSYDRRYISGINITPSNEFTDANNDFKWESVHLAPNVDKSKPLLTVDIPKYPQIEKETDDSDDEKYNKDYEIRVNSTFATDKGNKDVNGENKRTVQAIYTIKVPNYDDVVFGKGDIEEHSIYKDKGITIGGNMIVGENTSGREFNLTVNGNVFVEGKQDSNVAALANKYRGGISLNYVNNVDFKGNVVTGKTFNIGENAKNASVTNSLYAGNVYAGKADGIAGNGNGSKLIVNQDMILNNDLTLNAINTDIETKNFYGINSDRSNNSSDEKSGKITNSSSIIVNKYKDNEDGSDKSKITIDEAALIMGVAYINTGNGYATGESAGVKGNYNAYSEYVDSDNNNADFDAQHDLDSPLYLVNGNDVNGNVFDKGEHFYNYWNGNTEKLDTGGIHFGQPQKIKSVGAIVYELNGKQVNAGKGAIDTLISESLPKQKDYALKEYKMDNGKLTDSDLLDLYNAPPVNIVAGLMNFSSEVQTIGNVNDEYGLFNPKTDRNIVIINDDSKTEIDISNLTGNTIIISVPSNKTLNAFIATAGDVSIQGKVDVKGNIIAEGNLEIKDSGDKTITYDATIAKDLQMTDEGAKIFKQVFGEGDVNTESSLIDTEIVVQYDLPKFFKNILWKLIK